MTATLPATDRPDLTALADSVRGRVLAPADPEYPALAMPWNVAAASAPVAVVEVLDAADVAATLRFAAGHGYDVAVQATGHGAVHYDRPTVLVATRRLDRIEVDAAARTARVGAGVRWRDLVAVTAPLGLSGLPGSTSDVGVVGYLTGGGLSPLGRTFGYASDQVTAFDVVTGDGLVRRATPTENPGLFWGLRGGKGALGIVVAVEFDLLPVAEILGGTLFFAGDAAPTVLPAWRAWSAGLPEQASTSIVLQRLPDLPGVPAPLAGRLTVGIRFAWVGDADQGRAALAALGDLPPVLLGGVGPMPVAALDMIHCDPVDPLPTFESAALLDDLTPDHVRALLALAGPDVECPLILAEIRRLGGAFARPGTVDSAVDHREAQALVFLVGLAIPPLAEANAAVAGAVREALADHTVGAPPNFNSSADPARVARGYRPATLARLGMLAAAYDPAGVLTAAHAVRAACLGRN